MASPFISYRSLITRTREIIYFPLKKDLLVMIVKGEGKREDLRYMLCPWTGTNPSLLVVWKLPPLQKCSNGLEFYLWYLEYSILYHIKEYVCYDYKIKLVQQNILLDINLFLNS